MTNTIILAILKSLVAREADALLANMLVNDMCIKVEPTFLEYRYECASMDERWVNYFEKRGFYVVDI
jgi:hypothetical protein